jgi:hypothetical protein
VIARAVAYVVAVLVVVMVQTNGVQDAFFANVLVLLLSKDSLCLPRQHSSSRPRPVCKAQEDSNARIAHAVHD